jgi:spore germination protein KC
MKKIILIIIVLCTSGCWDRREIKWLGIVNSNIFDYKKGKIMYTAEVVNPATKSTTAKSGAQTTPYLYIKSEGKDIPSALFNINSSFNKTLYTAHVKATFITEEFAKKEGIVGFLDYLLRHHDSRQQQYLIVVKGEDAAKLFQSTSGLSDLIGDYVENIEIAQKSILSKTVFVNALDVLKAYYDKGTQPIFGVVQKETVKKSEDQNSNPTTPTKDGTKLKFEGMAIFKDDKLNSYLTGEETELYNFIMGTLKSMTISSEKTVFKVVVVSPDTKIQFKNNRVQIKLNIKADMIVEDDLGKHDFSKIKELRRMEKKVNKQLEDKLNNFLTKTQKKIGVDFFKFGSKFHIQCPEDWKKLKNKWDEYFSRADIITTVSSSISGEGKITKSIRMEK